MKVFKNIYLYFPELLLLSISMFYCLYSIFNGENMHSFTVVSSILLISLLIWRNKYFALILSILLVLGCLCMLWSVIEGFGNFPDIMKERIRFLLISCTGFITIGVFAVIMPFKYWRKNYL